MHRRHFTALTAAAAAAPLATTGARAQGVWPQRTISWVVPFTPGGVTDTTSRALGRRMGELLGQQIVIENRPGAGGSLGTESVARAAPDGYTWLYGTSGTMAANLFLYKNLKYDPLKDFTPVHAMLLSPTVLVVEASSRWQSVADLVKEAKANPGKLNFGSAGAGTGTHLTGELFQTEAGVKLQHIPYKGTTPALQDLLGGRVDLMFDYMTPMMPQIRGGKLRALAVMSHERMEALPDVPTIVQAGFPNSTSFSWSGIVVPSGTPADAVKKIGDALATVLKENDVVGPFVALGSKPMHDVRDKAFVDFIVAEQKKWGEVVRKSGATLG